MPDDEKIEDRDNGTVEEKLDELIDDKKDEVEEVEECASDRKKRQAAERLAEENK